MLRRITRVKELNEQYERCEKHEAKLAARRADQEEEEEWSRPEEDIIDEQEDEKELPFQNILANERRKYSLKQEYVYLLYNDLIRNFVKKWDGTYLRKNVGAKNESFEVSSKNDSEETADETFEKHDEASIDRKKLNNVDWKFYAPDEEAEITFINDNSYNGRISRQKMEGQGFYRWRNGSQYKGDFEDNKIQGKGLLEWQDTGWYEGDFQDGYRHGKGTMVDKNYNLLYIGQWHEGHKHGKGYCRFENNESYEGDWKMDKRHGLGNRIYASGSRYVGDWKDDLRHGIGTMAWSNGDVYRGEWKNGKMHGYGEYTWNGFFNNTLSWPPDICYMGEWDRSTRNGEGQMTLNSIGGTRYSGQWRKNKKHGVGKIIGNNGEITEGDPLFENDVLLPILSMKNLAKFNEEEKESNAKEMKKEKFIEKHNKIPKARVTTILQPEQYISLHYYVNRFRIKETIDSVPSLVSLTSGKCRVCENKSCHCLEQSNVQSSHDNEDLQLRPLSNVSKLNEDSTASTSILSPHDGNYIVLPDMRESQIPKITSNLKQEEHFTYNCIIIHMPRIKKIYDIYSKIFCKVSPNCRLSMCRLSLWQLWRDCGIHEKAMSLVEIDKCLAANKSTLMENSSCPFGKIEIWQLIHALLEVSWQLYTKHDDNEPPTRYPGKLANGLDKFLVNDLYPNIGKSTGILCGAERDLAPLYPIYQLYKIIGEPHSARELLKSIFKINDNSHGRVSSKSLSIETTDPKFMIDGRNAVTVGEKLCYLSCRDKPLIDPAEPCIAPNKQDDSSSHSLFVFRELGTKEFIEIMSCICPSIKDPETGVIVNMEYELTFLEFFEIFIKAGKQLVLKRKMEHLASMKKADVEERFSISPSVKDHETRRSSVRLSARSKSMKSKKKLVMKR